MWNLEIPGKSTIRWPLILEPLVFVGNGASSRARITSDSAIEFSQHGTLAPSIIHQRSDFASSMVDGRTVMEIGRKSPSTDEITELWTYLDERLARLRLTEKRPPEHTFVYGFGAPERPAT